MDKSEHEEAESGCPLSLSEDKHESAHYFIEGMMNNYHHPDVFRWNLNACLEALRNTTFTMQKQLASRPWFSEWWNTQVRIMRADQLLQKFKNGRNIAVKEGSLSFKSTAIVGLFKYRKLKLAYYVPAPINMYSEDILERIKPLIIGDLIDEEHSEIGMEIGVQRVWLTQELGEGEIIGLCDNAYAKIAGILNNAHKMFRRRMGVPPPHLHDVSKVNLMTESDVDPSLPKKWEWI